MKRSQLCLLSFYFYPSYNLRSQIPLYISVSSHDRIIVTIQSLSHVQLFGALWTTACQSPLSFTVSQSLLKFMSTESVMLSNHLILCHPLLLLPSIFPSIRVFSSESALCIRWPNYWSFSFSNSPSNDDSGLISFRTDWFDLLAVQGTLPGLAIPLKTRRKWDKIYETTFSGTGNREIRITVFGIGITSSGMPGAILLLWHRKVSL